MTYCDRHDRELTSVFFIEDLRDLVIPEVPTEVAKARVYKHCLFEHDVSSPETDRGKANTHLMFVY
jgi:hypothetical protein